MFAAVKRLALAGDRTRHHDDLRPVRRLGIVKHRGEAPVLFPAHCGHSPIADDLLEHSLGEPLVGPVLRGFLRFEGQLARLMARR